MYIHLELKAWRHSTKMFLMILKALNLKLYAEMLCRQFNCNNINYFITK